MKRRNVIVGLAGLTAAGAAALGSGAFANVKAKRTVSINVASDTGALLRLKPLEVTDSDGNPTGRSVTTDDGGVKFVIPGGEESSASGVGVNSQYEFHDLVRIENQGTQTVSVYSTYDGSALNGLSLIDPDRTAGNELLTQSNPAVLGTGESITAGLYIDTSGSTTNSNPYDETLTLVGE